MIDSTEEFLQVSFVIRKVKRRFDPPLEIPPESGWQWHYECFAQVFLVNDLNPKNAVEFFGYRVDGKVYTGRYVPAGYKYRIYHIGGGCVTYGIESLEDAIARADELLEKSLLGLRLSRSKDEADRSFDFTGQLMLSQEVGHRDLDLYPRIITPLEYQEESD